jgi:hypothetical protein
VALGYRRPTTPFPKVFGIIDRAMKDFYRGQRAEALAPGAPAGVIGSPDRWVKSVPTCVPGCRRPIVFRGRLDAMVACDDGTTGVIDFKTALPADAHLPLYARQLHVYAWALERPAAGRPTKTGALGLVCFSPDRFEAGPGSGALCGGLEWLGLPRDDDAFARLLTQVLATLDSGCAPPPSPTCPWC